MNGNEQRPDGGPEWDFLEGLWRDVPAMGGVPEELRRRVRREEARLRIYALSEWLLAAIFMIWGVLELVTFTDSAGFLRGFLFVWLTSIALSFSLHTRRGLWVPAAESTRAYLAISRARIDAGWRTIGFAWLLFLFQILLIAGIEIAHRLKLIDATWSGDAMPLSALVVGVFTFALAAWSLLYARVLRRRATALAALRRELEQEDLSLL